MWARRFSEQSLVVAGILGQVAFYAGFGRTSVPVWLRVGVHLAVALPLLLVSPPTTTCGAGGIPPTVDGGRPLRARLAQASVALASAFYLVLAVGSLVLVARGSRGHGLASLLVLQSMGAAAAGVALSAAVRFLAGVRPRVEPLYQRPWAGAYRTRPTIPREPAPRAPPAPPSPRREALGHGVLSLAFCALGALMAHHPNHVGDRFWGLATVVFFGLCAVIFCEQWVSLPPVAMGETPKPLAPPIREPSHFRMIGALGVAGVAGIALAALAGDGVPLFQRAMVGAMSALLAAVAGWASCKAFTRNHR
jgi:hypothetical protein